MPLLLEIVTPERLAYSDEVDSVQLPGIEGELGVLPHHAPLVTLLKPGVLRIRQGPQETELAVGGGFMQVLPTQVTVLADTAERAEEIDEERAQQARERALAAIQNRAGTLEAAQAEESLRRSMVRLKLVQRRRRGDRPMS